MAILSPSPKLQFFDANGNPLVGGKLYTYAAGTTTPLASYTDSSGGTANTNPIILDSRGEANVWLASGTAYKFVLQSAASTTIWTVDNIDATLGTMASQNANNVAITGGSITGLTTFTTTNGATIQGLTVGKGAGSVATNTAVGASALAANTTGDYSTAIGSNALAANTTGEFNTAVGRETLQSNTTGSQNTSQGYQAGWSETTSSDNSFFGMQAGRNTTTGASNTALGSQSLRNNTTASNNTAVGYQAGYANATGVNNTCLGSLTGISATGGYNTFVGTTAGYSVTTGTYNTFIGGGNALAGAAGYYVTTGSKNTILGGYNGNQGGLDIRTASNYIVLSDGDGNARGYYNGASNFWSFSNGGVADTVANFYNSNASSPYGLYVAFSAAAPNNTTNYFLACNDSVTSCFRVWSNGTTSGRSDERLKKNIAPANSQLADVMAMEVVNYEWNESIGGTKEIGWVAQQVQQIKPNIVQENDDGFLHLKREPMVAILWKAVQELNEKVDAQAAEIAAMKGQA
jgi:hypothetical protein